MAELSQDEEAGLYRHYGLDFSEARSDFEAAPSQGVGRAGSAVMSAARRPTRR